jgi:hypothetical protein
MDVEAAIREDNERTAAELLVKLIRVLVEGDDTDEAPRCRRGALGPLPTTTPFVFKRGR